MIRAALTTMLAAMVMVGCDNHVERQPAESKVVGIGYVVDRLFTHDGCTVYRFRDDGYYRYFTRCDGVAAQSSTSWSESCGKSCTRNVSIQTGGAQ